MELVGEWSVGGWLCLDSLVGGRVSWQASLGYATAFYLIFKTICVYKIYTELLLPVAKRVLVLQTGFTYKASFNIVVNLYE